MGGLAFVVPLVGALVELLRSRRGEVARQTGLDEGIVSKVSEAVEVYLTKDEKALAAVMAEVDKARQHDVAMGAVPAVVSLLRGLVRPVVTMAAFGWYVLARVCGIELGAEDYAIVGGIMAFWFGLRPFEKR